MLLPELRLSERAARDTGLSDVFEILAQMCGSAFGHEALAREKFPRSLDALGARTDEALEAARAVGRRVQPDFGAFRDVRPVIAAVQKGVVPAAQDILEVARVVDGIGRLHDVMVLQEETSPRLCARAR